MHQPKRSRTMMIAAMAIFGTMGPLVRNIDLSSGGVALCRAALAAAVLGVYLLVTRQRISIRALGREFWLVLLSGVALGLNWVTLFQAYRYTSISIATLCTYFAPVLIAAASPILFRERVTRRQVFCFSMATLGLILIVGVGGLSGGGTDLIGILFGLATAVLYAGVVLANKCIHRVAGIQRTFLQFAGALAVLIPYVAFTGGLHLEVLDTAGWISLLVVGMLHTGVTYCLYFTAMRDLPGQETAILSYIDPLLAVLLSVAVLGERITPLQILGGAMVLGFTLLNELAPGGREAQET